MGGMNPMGMNPMMMMGGMNPMGADGMNMFGQGMPGMGMGMGMPNMMPGMMPGAPQGMGMGAGPQSAGAMIDMNDGKFYKTKLCHKFMEGKCNYGPTCKYAHGEGDLRQGGMGGPPAPRPTGAGKVMTPHGPAMGGAAMGGMGVMPMQQPKPPSGDKNAHFRTRLCEQFMKEGQCRYGTTCTFAHGQHELRGFGGQGGAQKPMGTMPRQPQPPAPQGGQKRPLDGQDSMDMKRPRVELVTPPAQESLPDQATSMDLDALKQRYQALQQEANRFARDTGHSVAIFSVGGVYTDLEDTPSNATYPEEHFIAEVKAKDNTPVSPNLKVAVLKYGTGGVAKQLVTRGEIVKFISARGVKAMVDMHAAAAANDNPSA